MVSNPVQSARSRSADTVSTGPLIDMVLSEALTGEVRFGVLGAGLRTIGRFDNAVRNQQEPSPFARGAGRGLKNVKAFMPRHRATERLR